MNTCPKWHNHPIMCPKCIYILGDFLTAYFINHMLLSPRNEDVHVIRWDSCGVPECNQHLRSPSFKDYSLKVGCPVMLLRNLSTREGLCNGTHAIVAILKRWCRWENGSMHILPMETSFGHWNMSLLSQDKNPIIGRIFAGNPNIWFFRCPPNRDVISSLNPPNSHDPNGGTYIRIGGLLKEKWLFSGRLPN